MNDHKINRTDIDDGTKSRAFSRDREAQLRSIGKDGSLAMDAANQIREAKHIIADLVEYAECNDPGNPHIGKAKGFLSGGEHGSQ